MDHAGDKNYEMDERDQATKTRDSNDGKIQELEEQLKLMQTALDGLKSERVVEVQYGGYTRWLADNIAIVGLREAITWEHKILKGVWILLVILGCVATGYYIYTGVDEYLNNESATKISLVKYRAYEFPPLALCPPWWFNNQTIDSLGIARKELAYSLVYAHFFKTYYSGDYDKAMTDLVPADQLDNATEKALAIEHTGKSFLDFYKKRSFASLPDYYKTIASNFSIDCGGDRCVASNEAELTFQTGACRDSTTIEKEVFNNALCYVFRLDKATPKTKDQPLSLQLINRDFTAGMLDESRKSWLIDFVPNIGTVGPSLELKPSTLNRVKITPQRTIFLPDESVCVDTSTKANADYNQKSCAEKCTSKATNLKGTDFEGLQSFSVTNDITKMYNELQAQMKSIRTSQRNGTVAVKVSNIAKLNNVTMEFNNTVEVTNSTTNKRNDTFSVCLVIDDNTEELLEACFSKCLPPCDATRYDVTIESASDIEKEAGNASVVTIVLQHGAVMQGGIITWQEVPTLTFTGFISNVGGTLGLFLGCTIMTVAQLILSCVNYVLLSGKSCKRRRKDAPTPNGLKMGKI